MYWSPQGRLSASALPNLDGDYRLQGTFQQSYQHRWSALSENDLYSLVHDYSPTNLLNVQSGVEYQDRRDRSVVFSQVNWQPDIGGNQFIQAGASFSESEFGFQITWRRRWRPGIETDLAWNSDYQLTSTEFDQGEEILFTVRLDFAAVDGGLRAANNQNFNFTRGGVAGRIVTTEGQRLNIEGVNLRVNGRTLPQQQAGGGFFLGGLPPGVYDVELDEAQLPLEYSVVEPRFRVRVASAAVTAFDYRLRRATRLRANCKVRPASQLSSPSLRRWMRMPQ